MKLALFMILFILLTNTGHAAKITGIVYDDNVEPVSNAIVMVNSTPKQIIISKEGRYAFELSPGTYVINATYADLFTFETISIQTDGVYSIDLLLFPTEQTEELEESLSVFEEKKKKSPLSFLPILILVGIVLFLYARKRKETHHEDDENVRKIMSLLEKHEGRVTQREIRKEIPLSEAKISILLSELEAKGQVKKIRKGRGNIIVKERINKKEG